MSVDKLRDFTEVSPTTFTILVIHTVLYTLIVPIQVCVHHQHSTSNGSRSLPRESSTRAPLHHITSRTPTSPKMGWLDTFTTAREDPVKDTLKDLDPDLRKYLESQSPSTYKTAQETGTSAPQSYREQLGLKHNDPEQQQKAKDFTATIAATSYASTTELGQEQQQAAATIRPLPKQSLYQDGRYAHLWSTYRPQTEIEESGKSDQEKLLDIVGGYKERQAEVGRAALENCSNEQWAVHDCFRNGSWSALSSMCKAENRALSRCVMMQGRFLRALGYLSMYERSESESESIQMHADSLYQRMLEEEKANIKAKKMGEKGKGGEEIVDAAVAAASKSAKVRGPRFGDSAFEGETLPPHRSGAVNYDSLPPDVQKRVAANRLVGLKGEALELAKREIDNELAFHTDVLGRLNDHYLTEHQERLARQEAGTERIGDRIKRVFDFRKYGDETGAAPEQVQTSVNATDVSK